MSHIIKSYNFYTEKQIIKYIDYSINESLSPTDIWNKISSKIKDLSYDSKKRVIKHFIAGLMGIGSLVGALNMIQTSTADKETIEIAKSVIKSKTEENDWKKGYEFTLSDSGWKHIRNEEKLKLQAYSIGDGMITIGYGHAEPENNSQYKVGDIISKNQANKLLRDDLKKTADGVRRIFKEWEDKGIEVKINQDMFDALVSIAYNTGIGSLRTSDLIQDIKVSDFKSAGEKIKNFKTSPDFPGLEIRREKESKMFLASL